MYVYAHQDQLDRCDMLLGGPAVWDVCVCVRACVCDMFVLVSRYRQRGRLRCVFIEGVRECCTRQSMVSVPYRELFGRWAYLRMMCVCRYTVRAHAYASVCALQHLSVVCCSV